MNASRDIKIGDSIRHTTNGIINHFGIQNCYFITIGLSGDSSLRPISKKLKKFLRCMASSMRCAICVFGKGQKSLHAHVVGVFLPNELKREIKGKARKCSTIKTTPNESPTVCKIRRLVKMAKSKAKFGHVFEVERIKKSADAVAGYLRRNFLQMDEYRKFADHFVSAKLQGYRYYRVPEHLKISPKSFSRHTPSASRYRCVMTGLAQCVGTAIGDVRALEDETGLSFEQLRHVAFGLCNTTPGNPKKWPPRLFANALSEAGSNHNQFKINRKAKIWKNRTTKNRIPSGAWQTAPNDWNPTIRGGINHPKKRSSLRLNASAGSAG